MTSLTRLVTAMGHREPDRVPFLLPATLHAAREVGLALPAYFRRAEHVIEGQLRVRARYGHDAVLGFLYGPLEIAAWGGEVIFRDDGPPNSGEPPLRVARLDSVQPPGVADCPGLQLALAVIAGLKARVGDAAPVLGAVISPFSLPVMQLGFDRYLELLYEQPERCARLLAANEEFCVEWANAQLAAGATAISYADPLASPTILPRELWLRSGLPLARRTLARIGGGVAVSLASGRCLPLVDDLAAAGAVGVGASVHDDLAAVKAACRGRLTVLGNLNAIEMRRWTAAEAEAKVKEAIRAAGPGGGYVLTDNHGEIPLQVPDDVLLAIGAAVETWGRYPLNWVSGDG
jgi:uroporphyrinogen decarboxylase